MICSSMCCYANSCAVVVVMNMQYCVHVATEDRGGLEGVATIINFIFDIIIIIKCN